MAQLGLKHMSLVSWPLVTYYFHSNLLLSSVGFIDVRVENVCIIRLKMSF